MSIKRIDKKVINNENISLPCEGTLDAAMNEISKKKQKKSFSWRKFIPIMASCLAVIVVLAMIPAMIPANSSAPYTFVAIEDMQIQSVESVKEYYTSQDIKHFSQQPTEAKLYKYGDLNCFVQEVFDMDGVKVDYIVKLNWFYEYKFAIKEDFLKNVGGGNYETINNYTVLCKQDGNTVYAYITSNLDYEYMLTFDYSNVDSDKMGGWKNIIEELLN